MTESAGANVRSWNDVLGDEEQEVQEDEGAFVLDPQQSLTSLYIRY